MFYTVRHLSWFMPGASRKGRPANGWEGAFTFVELMGVITIMVTMMALVTPAFTQMKNADDVTKAAYEVAGVLERARAYAIANNTYVWVGFYEEDAVATSPTNSVPPYSGKGLLVLAMVASKNGTPFFCKSDPSAPLPGTGITQVANRVTLEGVHMADIGRPNGGDVNLLDGRPDTPYTFGSPNDHYNRINSESSDKTLHPFSAQNYTFYKTVRFSPRGEANVNSTYDIRTVVEIGLQPTRGTRVDTANRNVAAVQITGVLGNVKIYRR